MSQPEYYLQQALDAIQQNDLNQLISTLDASFDVVKTYQEKVVNYDALGYNEYPDENNSNHWTYETHHYTERRPQLPLSQFGTTLVLAAAEQGYHNIAQYIIQRADNKIVIDQEQFNSFMQNNMSVLALDNGIDSAYRNLLKSKLKAEKIRLLEGREVMDLSMEEQDKLLEINHELIALHKASNIMMQTPNEILFNIMPQLDHNEWLKTPECCMLISINAFRTAMRYSDYSFADEVINVGCDAIGDNECQQEFLNQASLAAIQKIINEIRDIRMLTKNKKRHTALDNLIKSIQDIKNSDAPLTDKLNQVCIKCLNVADNIKENSTYGKPMKIGMWTIPGTGSTTVTRLTALVNKHQALLDKVEGHTVEHDDTLANTVSL